MKFEKGDVVYDFYEDQLMIFKFYFDEKNGAFDSGLTGHIYATVTGLHTVVLISKSDFA